MRSRRNMAAAAGVVVVSMTCVLAAVAVRGQTLTVVPVNIQMGPGQKAATLTVTNDGTTTKAIQIRTFDWSQPAGKDELTPSTEVIVSPPMATIAPGDSQVIRIMLRRAPLEHEATYRILLDEIPPASELGVIHVVLRLSIPIFAQPALKVTPHLQFQIECEGSQIYLVGLNDGLRHDAIRDIELETADGRKLKAASPAPPYILAGVTRRWIIVPQGPPPRVNDVFRMTAQADSGAINQQVRCVGVR